MTHLCIRLLIDVFLFYVYVDTPRKIAQNDQSLAVYRVFFIRHTDIPQIIRQLLGPIGASTNRRTLKYRYFFAYTSLII